MKVLCLLLLLGLAATHAHPSKYRAGPVAVFDDDDASDEAEVDDDIGGGDDDSDVYSFGTGGPGGPPSNEFIDGPSRQAREGASKVTPSSVYYETEKDIPEGVYFTYDNDDGPAPVATAVARRENSDSREESEDENENTIQDEEEEEEDEEEEDDDPEQSDDGEPDYAVPDMNKLFPNPQNLPRGPGSYQQFMNNLPKKPQNQSPSGPQRGAPPRSPHYSSGYQGRVPPPPPTRRVRTTLGPMYPVSNHWAPSRPTLENDAVVVSAPTHGPVRRYWRMEDDDAEDEAEDEEEEEEEEAADDVDYSVPKYEVLFPSTENKANPPFMHNMKHSWDNSPQPPNAIRGRILPLFSDPLHDRYNPEFVIDPTLALNERNRRMRKRYSHPAWRMQNVKHPWNYKPLLYQQGHWGNPRDYGHHPHTNQMYHY